jgi:ubiquinol-cytochrome c reductase iron-sulfur subunit
MSNEIEAIKDPGLPAHVHRKADHDPVAARRAERQVASMFMISALGTVLLIASFFIPEDVFIFVPVMGDQNAHQLGLGLGNGNLTLLHRNGSNPLG